MATNPTNDGFFDGGWCWMCHPSLNDGNPIPVKMQVVSGTRWYYPLDPTDATEYEWDRRDERWEIVSPALAAPLIAAAPDLLAAAKRALNVLKAQGESVQPKNVLGALNAAINKAEGSA
jgi:hypothetical protein